MAKKKYFTIHHVDTFREVYRTDDPIELVHWFNDEAVNMELHEMVVADDGKFHGAEFIKEKFGCPLKAWLMYFYIFTYVRTCVRTYICTYVCIRTYVRTYVRT